MGTVFVIATEKKLENGSTVLFNAIGSWSPEEKAEATEKQVGASHHNAFEEA